MYENELSIKITKKQILAAARKSLHVGKIFDMKHQGEPCNKCFFHELIKEVGNINVLCKCTYIREYFTCKYGVDFKNISHCEKKKKKALKKVISQIHGRKAVKI